MGFRTGRKIIVIESDDWGNIKLNDKDQYIDLAAKRVINDSPYFRYDSLETNADLEELFNVLYTFKDSKGNHPKITGNFVLANPNFELIRNDSFENYYYTPVFQIYPLDKNRDKVSLLYKSAITEGLFRPQYHCREHLDVDRWMTALRNKDPIAIQSFNNNLVHISFDGFSAQRKGITASFDFNENFNHNVFIDYLSDMKSLFLSSFGFVSSTFIAPAYTWHPDIESHLGKIGVKAFQGLWKQTIPNPADRRKPYVYKKHFLGQTNPSQQIYMVRNSFFEPSLNPGLDSLNNCLKSIGIAFTFRKPAIIGTHRLNYMGNMETSNRAANLRLLKQLLKRTIERWPDVEFLSSDQLAEIILEESVAKY